MEFKQGILVDREIEIAYYLRHAFSMDRIVEKTGMNKKILQGHVRNMREKLHAEDTAALMEIIQCLPTDATHQPAVNNQLREATNTYFDSTDKESTGIGKRNVLLIAIALVGGFSAILFVCDRLISLFLASGFAEEIQAQFAY